MMWVQRTVAVAAKVTGVLVDAVLVIDMIVELGKRNSKASGRGD